MEMSNRYSGSYINNNPLHIQIQMFVATKVKNNFQIFM